ncbi:hypothetical protein PC123_g18414 [Phytophthora cactorum]|nr:hypothetical protein PC123_g18414 [Phytophthora cactorum]
MGKSRLQVQCTCCTSIDKKLRRKAHGGGGIVVQGGVDYDITNYFSVFQQRKTTLRTFFQVLAAVVFAAGAAALENGIRLGETFGGPHGKRFSDLDLASTGQIVRSITIRSGERVDAVSIDVTDPSGQTTTLYHGGGGGDKNTLTLGTDEYITGIEAHSGKHFGRTRIKYIEFTTNKRNAISGGYPTGNIEKDSAPEGYQLGGFVGSSANELDSVGAIWTSIEPVE